MQRKRNGPAVIAGPMLVHEDVGAVALLNPHIALVGPPLDCQPARVFDYLHDAIDHVIPLQPIPRRQWQQPTSVWVRRHERREACPLPPVLEGSMLPAGHGGLLADVSVASMLLLPATRSGQSEWQRIRRVVSLSGLGWAFVVAAVGWEAFALALSRCGGWGWDKGEFFFAWGLGLLAFGFYLRTGRQRPAVSRLFLGVNILVVSVLSLVIATR